MANQQLLDYIKQQLQQGVSKEQIKNSLIANGWQEEDINEAFSLASSPTPPISSLPGAIAIFKQAWAIYKRRLATFLGVMIIPTLVMIAMLVIMIAIVIFIGGELLGGGVSLFIPLLILLSVIILISQSWGQTALLYAIKDNQERIGVIESYRRGWHKILSYLWISLLAGIITLVGFLLLIVPGVIFAVWFSLAAFILVSENLKGMNALLKSKEYVKGKWGSVFWRLFFIGAISLIIFLVPTLIFNFLEIPFAKEIYRFVIGLFLIPLVMTYIFLVYNNLKALKGEITFTATRGKKTTFIAIGILGLFILSAILVGFDSLKKRAHDAKRQHDIMQIQVGLEMYYNEHNRYPYSLNELLPKYLPTMLVDPLTNQSYQYELQPDGRDYKICAYLRDTGVQKCLTSRF